MRLVGVKALAAAFLLCAQSVWSTPQDILAAPGLGKDRTRVLEQASDQVNTWMTVRTGQRPSGKYLLLGATADTVPDVLDAAYETLEKPRPQLNLNLAALCGGTYPNAIASADFILVCFPDDDDPVNFLRLSAVLAHEVFHQIQYDLSKTRDDRPGNGPRKLGPAWLVEGSAEVLELMYVQGLVPGDGPELFELQNPARRSRIKLSDLKAHGSVRDATSYGVARFAATLLARRQGVDGFINYFSGLGQGKSQAEAFRNAFGLSISSFETDFEQVRRDFGAARDWAVSQ